MDVRNEDQSDARFDAKRDPQKWYLLTDPEMSLLSSFLASFMAFFGVSFWHPGYPNVALWHLPYLDQ